jgi:ABC-type branched-subunit amino acid transport system substrate-binding protein
MNKYIVFTMGISLCIIQQLCYSNNEAKKKQHNLTAPIKIQKIANKNEVTICSSLPLKGETALIGNQIFDGLTLFFNKVKKEDQKGSLVVGLSTLDDHADITKTRKNTKKLLKKSPLFTSFFGPNSMIAVKQFIRTQQIAVFFPLDGMETFRQPDCKNVIYFRPPNTIELEALIHYTIEMLNKKKIAIFYEASDWGEECCSIIKKILDTKYQLKLASQSSYQYKTINIAQAVNTIAKNKTSPNAIICIAQARPAYNFIRQMINQGFHQTTFLGLGQLYSIQAPLKKSRGINIITSSVVPNPINSTLQIAKSYRNDMKKYYPNKPLTPFSFEGYINATIFYAALTYTYPPLTAQKIIDSLVLFQNFNFKGFTLNFDQKTHALSSRIWINTGEKQEWFLSPIKS